MYFLDIVSLVLITVMYVNIMADSRGIRDFVISLISPINTDQCQEKSSYSGFNESIFSEVGHTQIVIAINKSLYLSHSNLCGLINIPVEEYRHSWRKSNAYLYSE